MAILSNILKIWNIYKLIIILLVISSCSDKLPMMDRIESKEDLPTVSFENLKTTYTEQGIIKGKLQAQLAEQFESVEPHIDFKKGLSIVLFDKDNKIKTSLTADKAVYYTTKRTYEASGNVIVSNINGDIMTTEKLYGDELQNRIFTNALVKITKSDGSILYSKAGFESNAEFTIYKFIDVSGIIMSKGFSPDQETKPEQPENSNPLDSKPTNNNQKTQISPK
jgi:LPS export ABC transporter protein LptC